MALKVRSPLQGKAYTGGGTSRNPPAPTRTPSMLAHPHRALPPGNQWMPHERAGSQSAKRRLRQAAALKLKQLRKSYGGSTSVVGMEQGAVILDFGPTRIASSK